MIALTAGCGTESGPNIGYGYTLRATGGVYNDGSGRLGLAVLSTLRDGSGAGPDASWAATVTSPDSLAVEDAYPAGVQRGSYASWWWPELSPVAGSYSLSVQDGARSLIEHFDVSSGAGLDVPALSLVSDSPIISWPPVQGAVTYACQVFATDGSLQLSTVDASPGCDVSALPPGAYTASVIAYSADLAALGRNGDRYPSLPSRFDVSEARLGFTVTEPGASDSTYRALVAGGAIDYGGGTPGLAFWMSIAQADGTPSTVDWTVRVVGPELPVTSPLIETYSVNFPRLLYWSYDVHATPGTYSFTASSSAGTFSGSFTVGTPAPLAIPQNVSASPGPQGSATVTWNAVPGATSYLVSVYCGSEFVTSAWVGGTSIPFPHGTFGAGTYDVFVDATDADMLGGAVPTQVSVSENAYQPASFTVN